MYEGTDGQTERQTRGDDNSLQFTCLELKRRYNSLEVVSVLEFVDALCLGIVVIGVDVWQGRLSSELLGFMMGASLSLQTSETL